MNEEQLVGLGNSLYYGATVSMWMLIGIMIGVSAGDRWMESAITLVILLPVLFPVLLLGGYLCRRWAEEKLSADGGKEDGR